MCRDFWNRRPWQSKLRISFVAALASSLLALCVGSAQDAPRFPELAQAPSTTGTLAPAGDSKIESYRLTESSRPVLSSWQRATEKRTDIRVAIDERTAQALVFAPPAVHAQIREQLGLQANPQAPNPQAATPQDVAAAPEPTVGLSAPAGTVIVELRHTPGGELHTRLERLLSRQLPATVDASGDWQGFAVEAAPGSGVTMNVNAATGQVKIDGPPTQVAAWRAVVEALDSPPTAGNVTQLVRTRPASRTSVRQTLNALQSRAGGNRTTSAQTVAMLQQDADQSDAGAQPDAANQQAPGDQQQATQLAPSDLQTAIDAAQLAEEAGGLLGPVQVEYVEGLDVIVLRGADRDVQRVIEIINQIEQLSQETIPTIEIHQLQSVDSVQLAVLLNRLYTDVLGPRIGTVSITPLGKPNALLLIGREENVRMAVGLIQRLDQPAPPAAQFQVFPLQNASAAEAKTLIDAFLMQDDDGELQQDQPDATGPITDVETFPPLGPRAIIVADIRTNFLIVRASPRDLAEIAALIERIDLPGATAQLKVFTIRNGDASTLVTTLRTLFAVPAEGEAAAPGGISQGGVVRLQFSVDPRTNSIIAAGSADDLAVVEAILLRLDAEEAREGEYTVYRLRNAFAEGVANALMQMIQIQRQAETDAAVTVSPTELLEREVVIVPEPATNSLLISASPSEYQRIKAMIEELDERPPMVMIQVLIGEVTLTDTDEFGVELGLQDSLLFDRSLLSDVQFQNETTTNVNQTTTQTQRIISANGQPGFNFNNQALGNNLSTAALATAANVATQGLSNFSLNRVNNELGFGGFVFSASSSSVNVLLRALQENRRLEVLSRPQLMALDGQVGYVQVGQNVPRIVQTQIDALTGTTNTIQYEPVGLILQVVPRISPDGLVVLQIIANKSEVGPEAEGIPISVSPTGQVLRAPRIDLTQAQTTVSALSGQTVVLGGLLQTRKFDVHRRVPLIADIPLIGDLFRYDSVQESRRELIIILTPRIIYGKEDADLVKQIESSRMSWILGDTVNLHGEAGLRSRCDEWNDADIEAVYPHHVPEEGLLPLSKNQMLMGPRPEFTVPYGEPNGISVPTMTPEPIYEAPPMPEQQPRVPLPPQTNHAPAYDAPQTAAAIAPDKYGFVDMAAPQQPPTSRNFPPLRLPEESE